MLVAIRNLYLFQNVAQNPLIKSDIAFRKKLTLGMFDVRVSLLRLDIFLKIKLGLSDSKKSTNLIEFKKFELAVFISFGKNI